MIPFATSKYWRKLNYHIYEIICPHEEYGVKIDSSIGVGNTDASRFVWR